VEKLLLDRHGRQQPSRFYPSSLATLIAGDDSISTLTVITRSPARAAVIRNRTVIQATNSNSCKTTQIQSRADYDRQIQIDDDDAAMTMIERMSLPGYTRVYCTIVSWSWTERLMPHYPRIIQTS
jgi:hypothetical protein